MSTPIRSRGFSVIEVLIVIVLLAIIAAVGFLTFHALQKNRAPAPAAAPPPAASAQSEDSAPATPAINNTGDLDSAQKALDSANLSSADSELDSQLSAF